MRGARLAGGGCAGRGDAGAVQDAAKNAGASIVIAVKSAESGLFCSFISVSIVLFKQKVMLWVRAAEHFHVDLTRRLVARFILNEHSDLVLPSRAGR